MIWGMNSWGSQGGNCGCRECTSFEEVLFDERTADMTISPYSPEDDDRIFALTCARKNARTDEDAAAIAWAEEEIETLRRERDEAVARLNNDYGEKMLPGSSGPRLDP